MGFNLRSRGTNLLGMEISGEGALVVLVAGTGNGVGAALVSFL